MAGEPTFADGRPISDGEDTTRCAILIRPTGDLALVGDRMTEVQQCSNPRGYGIDGNYCEEHFWQCFNQSPTGSTGRPTKH